MDRKDLMEDFRKQAVEISQHADDIDTLRFEARLKNGTRFSFNYDDELFTRHEKGEDGNLKQRRVSTVNGVSDIVSAAISLALMCVAASTKLRGGESGAGALLILTYISFTCYFTLSGIYHLFRENHKRTLKALFLVRHVLLSVSLLLLCLTVSRYGYDRGSMYVLFLFIAVLSVFLCSLDTRTGFRLAMLVQLAFAIALPFSAPLTAMLAGLSLLIAVNSLAGSLMAPGSTSLRTSPVFLAAALLVFYAVI